MSSRTVLVIEDDASIRRGIVDALELGGYTTLEAPDGVKGLASALTAQCDLILLDLVLPGPGGFEILQQVRQTRPTLPVIILTAKGEEDDRVRGLRLGADDYVVKPFGVRELLARAEAVLRRSPERPGGVMSVAVPGGEADLARREVRFGNGSREALSEKEAELLQYLAQNSGRAIAREEILHRVWRLEARHIETRTIDMHVARLREKLHDDPDEPQVIQTVRGKGYMFATVPPASRRPSTHDAGEAPAVRASVGKKS
jgi:DNA-binding response OmpR family regulator